MSSTRPFLFLRRGRVWTIVYPGPDGRDKQKATKFRGPEQEADAKKFLAKFIARLEAGAALAGDETGPMTVARWAKKWLDRCTAKGLSSVDSYASRLEHHVLPHIGHLRIDAVRPEHIEDIMAVVKGAPRTQRHVYDTMRAMFNKATTRTHDADGKATPALIEVSPCQIDPDDLPKKIDADPTWRRRAVFTREEVQLLTTSLVVPRPRRVLYSVSFMGGSRFGETSALHRYHYLPDMLPLAQLVYEQAWNSKKSLITETKTRDPRLMPVIPELKEIIDEWLEDGWPELMGRACGESDILIPTEDGTHRNSSVTWRQLNELDLPKLGLRPRRVHDTRRTTISLARAAGANDPLLKYCTHGPGRKILDVYTEYPWADLCREVGKLRIGRPPAPPPGNVVILPKSAKSLSRGLPLDCHAENPQAKGTVTALHTRVRIPLGSPRQTTSYGDSDGQPAEDAGLSDPGLTTAVANEDPAGSMATLATLALRQALDALHRGRLDEVQAILERSLEVERGVGNKA